ncbi:MAG: helix-turn-helix transcriptional regulator [Clostridia bacterium]|nr:helix-turn-helix transcriptional regulator [Clostridia bacterium]
MNFGELNPTIYSAAIYDRGGKASKRCERISYASRLIYVFSGEIGGSIDGKKITSFGSGALLYIPAGTRYALFGQYMRAAVISFSPTGNTVDNATPIAPEEFNSELCPKETAPFDKVIRIDELEAVWGEIEEITELFISEDVYSLAKAAAILKLILIRVAEATDENALPLRMLDTLDDYIREHAGDEISNTEIGAIFGYHPFYVSTVMKEKRGITLRQYIISYRLRLSKNLLRYTTKTIAQIAEETGFTDASYFTKTFKAAFGETPKEWRAKFQEEYI